jgi:hypothetical protein
MERRVPRVLWVSIVALIVISVVQLTVAVALGHPMLLISVGANLVFAWGLHRLQKWAYVLTAAFCVLGAVVMLGSEPGIGVVTLLVNAVVLVPILMTTKDFWRTPAEEIPAAPTCPNCGYSLMGLTQPRCPECGQEFRLPD